jgi:hypothetical protein
MMLKAISIVVFLVIPLIYLFNFFSDFYLFILFNPGPIVPRISLIKLKTEVPLIIPEVKFSPKTHVLKA